MAFMLTYDKKILISFILFTDFVFGPCIWYISVVKKIVTVRRDFEYTRGEFTSRRLRQWYSKKCHSSGNRASSEK